MPTLFISDLHLEDARPGMTRVLLDFLEGEARRADELYILGDLFEFWIGDDVLTDTAREVAVALRAVADAGVPCFFMHGNRDFLVGETWARRAGLRLLAEETVVDLHGEPTLLLHGDTLCTDDAEYQAFRSQVRNPAWQAAFLSRSVEERLAVARQARGASKAHTASAAMEIMDVNAAAVAEAFRRHGVRRMIHGHTHRPATHALDVDGEPCERIVLADWYDKGSVLRVSPGGIERETLD